MLVSQLISFLFAHGEGGGEGLGECVMEDEDEMDRGDRHGGLRGGSEDSMTGDGR